MKRYYSDRINEKNEAGDPYVLFYLSQASNNLRMHIHHPTAIYPDGWTVVYSIFHGFKY
jgi:hypothetical protein